MERRTRDQENGLFGATARERDTPDKVKGGKEEEAPPTGTGWTTRKAMEWEEEVEEPLTREAWTTHYLFPFFFLTTII